MPFSVFARDPVPAASALGGYRQAFPAFGAAALEDDAAVFGLHPDKEAVRAAPAAPVWLERTFHRNSSGKSKKSERSNLQS